MSWGAPGWLPLLLLPGALALSAVLRHRARLRDQRALAGPEIWRRVMGGAPATGLVRMLAWCAALAAAVVALARPQWGEEPRTAEVRTRDVVVAVDVSASMRCPDVPPDRLNRGLAVVRHALPLLAGNRLAAVVFAGEAYPLVPLTIDLEAAATFFDGVEPGMVGRPGSNIERAVDSALELLPAEGRGRVMVLVTDGESLQGDVARAAERLSDAGVVLIGLLCGTPDGGLIPMEGPSGTVYKRGPDGQPVVTRADSEVLETLAGRGGAVVEAGDAGASNELAEVVARVQAREAEAGVPVRRTERFPVFLAIAAGMVIFGFAVPPWRRLAPVVVCLLLVLPASASEQANEATPEAAATRGPEARAPLWQKVVPGGARRLARTGAARWEDENLDGAVEAFAQARSLDPDDPVRVYDLGTSLAAQDGLDRAAPLLARAAESGLEASAAFNLGTAALESGRPDQAVTWLRRALLADSDSPDVKHNYELALRQLKRRQRQRQHEDEDQQRRREQPRPTPTPTPQASPSPAPGAAPTPTPPPSNQPLFGALERAEEEARRNMQRRTPTAAKVEKDW